MPRAPRPKTTGLSQLQSLRKLLAAENSKKILPVAAAFLLVAGTGIHLLFSANAASSTASAEAESGTVSGGASIVSDSTASSSKAVKFSTTTTSSSLKLGVPVYWYPPSSYDTQLDGTGGKVGFAIANIDSGPGSGTESNFNTQINNERAAGIKVYGYVDTAYGARSLSATEADVDAWYSYYNLDGIMFDEVTGPGWTTAQKSYYQSIYNYVKAKTGANVHGNEVVLNPGAATDEYAMQVSDIISDYEDVEANYAGATFPSWTKNYPASHFFHIIHTSAGISQMQNDIALAKTRNVGYVFVTTDSGGNPYDTLPASSFWTAELNAL